MSYLTLHGAGSVDSSNSAKRSTKAHLKLRAESTNALQTPLRVNITDFSTVGSNALQAPGSTTPQLQSDSVNANFLNSPIVELLESRTRKSAVYPTGAFVRRVSFGGSLIVPQIKRSYEGQKVILKSSQASIGRGSVRSLGRSSPQSPLSNIFFHKFDLSKDIFTREQLYAESNSFPNSLSLKSQDSHKSLEIQKQPSEESKKIKVKKGRLSFTEAAGVAIMVTIIVAAIVLVAALLFQPEDNFVLSQTTVTQRVETSKTKALITSTTPSTKGNDLENITLKTELTKITSDRQSFHEHAFLHRGPVYGIGEGTYLVNGSVIYLITEADPPALQQITGRSQSEDEVHKFSLILGLAISKDGSEMFISDYRKAVIKQYIVEYNKMVDFVTTTYEKDDGYAALIPDLIQPSVLELFATSIFVVVNSNSAAPQVLQINVFTKRMMKLPVIRSASPFAIRDMAMRDSRLYICVNNEILGLDTVLIDSSYNMLYDADPVEVSPLWERVISPEDDSMVVSNEIEDCRSLELSPDHSQVYVVNRLTGGQIDSILQYNFSIKVPGDAHRLIIPAVPKLNSLAVRSSGTKALLLSDKALYTLAFNHSGSPERSCVFCDEAPPGTGYVPYDVETTQDDWIIQSQSVCFSKEENFAEAFQGEHVEGQIRYYKCEDGKLYWDGDKTWYKTIPYVCSVDSPIKQARFNWSCDAYVCNQVVFGETALPCENGGTCMFMGKEMPLGKQFLCLCADGFYGDKCEKGRPPSNVTLKRNSSTTTQTTSSTSIQSTETTEQTNQSSPRASSISDGGSSNTDSGSRLPPIRTTSSTQKPAQIEEKSDGLTKVEEEAIIGSVTGTCILIFSVPILGAYCYKKKRRRNSVADISQGETTSWVGEDPVMTDESKHTSA